MDFAAFPLHIKSLDETGVIEGYGSTFGGEPDSYGDIVDRGAFTKSLAAHRARGTAPAMLYQHDQKRPIGRWTHVAESSEGLELRGKLTMAAPDAQVAYALAKDGALGGLSIGFNVPPGGQRRDQAKGVTHLSQIDLLEVSLVTLPANTSARITTVKGICGARDIEELLREGGLSSRQAKAAASAAWRTINESKNDDEAEAQAKAILDASAARIRAMGRN